MTFRTRSSFWGKQILQVKAGDEWCDVKTSTGEFELVLPDTYESMCDRIAEADRRAAIQKKARAAKKTPKTTTEN